MHIPQPGERYRHYKSTWGDDYTYEIIAIAKHSESDELLVVYKPLYVCAWENRLWNDATVAVRPLSMRYDPIEWQWKTLLRFSKIV